MQNHVTELIIEQPDDETRTELERRQYFDELGIPEITPAERAEWDTYLDVLLERLAKAEADIAENQEVARRRIQMIQAWEHSANESLQRQAGWLRQQVEMFARGYDYGSKTSRQLPHGEFGTKKKPDSIEIVDQEKALGFARRVGLEIKVEEKVQKTPLKAFYARWSAGDVELFDEVNAYLETLGERPLTTDEFFTLPLEPGQVGWEFKVGSREFYVKPAGVS